MKSVIANIPLFIAVCAPTPRAKAAAAMGHLLSYPPYYIQCLCQSNPSCTISLVIFLILLHTNTVVFLCIPHVQLFFIIYHFAD